MTYKGYNMTELTLREWQKEDIKVFNKIIEKNTYINVEDINWYECDLLNFIEDSKKEGFYITQDDIQFSGFCSQGDGASFTGVVDLLEYLTKSKLLTSYRSLVKEIRSGWMNDEATISRSHSNYLHENTCSVDDIYVESDNEQKLKYPALIKG